MSEHENKDEEIEDIEKEDEEPGEQLTVEEKYQKILARIDTLEKMKTEMEQTNQQMNEKLKDAEDDVDRIREVINRNIFANIPESKELQELKLIRKVFEHE